MVADGVGVVPDDVTTRSDPGEESIVSAREVNRDEFPSGQKKAMVFYPWSSSHTRLCLAVPAHNVAMRVNSPLTRIRVSLESTGEVNRHELAMAAQ